jgi:hypothetical protein
MKSAPAFMAAALTDSRWSSFSLIGTAIAFLTIGVAQATSPTPSTGAKCTGSLVSLELALAICTA